MHLNRLHFTLAIACLGLPVLGLLSGIVLLICALFLWFQIGPRDVLGSNRVLTTLVLGYSLGVLATCMIAGPIGEGLKEAAKWAPIVLLLPLYHVFKTTPELPALISRWLPQAVITACVIVGIEFVLTGLQQDAFTHRAQALSVNPNFVSTMLLVFVLWMFVDWFEQTPNRQKLTALAGCLALISVPVFMGSRTALIVLLGSLLILFTYTSLCNPRKRTSERLTILGVLVLGSFVVLAILMVAPNTTRFNVLLEFIVSGDSTKLGLSASLRFDTWVAAWEAIKAHPLLGYGFQNESAAFHPYLTGDGLKLLNAHNIYLSYLLGGGLVVLIAGLGFQLSPVLAGRNRTEGSRLLGATTVLPIAVLSINSSLLQDARMMIFYFFAVVFSLTAKV